MFKIMVFEMYELLQSIKKLNDIFLLIQADDVSILTSRNRRELSVKLMAKYQNEIQLVFIMIKYQESRRNPSFGCFNFIVYFG